MGARDIHTSPPVEDNGRGGQLSLKIAVVLTLVRYLTTYAPHSPLVISILVGRYCPLSPCRLNVHYEACVMKEYSFIATRVRSNILLIRGPYEKEIHRNTYLYAEHKPSNIRG